MKPLAEAGFRGILFLAVNSEGNIETIASEDVAATVLQSNTFLTMYREAVPSKLPSFIYNIS